MPISDNTTGILKRNKVIPNVGEGLETFAWKANFHLSSESLKLGISFDPSTSQVGIYPKETGVTSRFTYQGTRQLIQWGGEGKR